MSESSMELNEEYEKLIYQYFNVHLNIDKVIARHIKTGKRSSSALLYGDHNIYALFMDDSYQQTYHDVISRAKKIGIVTDKIFPPNGDDEYFDTEAKRYYSSRFPGLRQWSNQESEYYRRYAMYCPALIRVSSINRGVRQLNSPSGEWQKIYNLSFQKIKVS